MKRIVFALVIILSLIISLGACSEKETLDAGDPLLETNSIETTEPRSTKPAITEANTPSSVELTGQDAITLNRVHIDLASNELLEQYFSFYEYVLDEDGANILIWTDETVTDFAFFTVHTEESEDSLSFSVDEELAFFDIFSSEKPLVVKLLIPGLIPAYGISYVDENENEKLYTINLDGRGEGEAPPYFLLEFKKVK